MPSEAALDFVPLWALFALTVGLVLVWIEVGFRIGRRRAAATEHETPSSVAAMSNASLALLAFLLAFTFGFAASRLERRRTLMLDEVNAIGTTYLRAATLPDPERMRAQALLRDYVDARLEAVRGGRVDVAIQRSQTVHNELWNDAARLALRAPQSLPMGLYLQTLNEMIDLHTTRLNESVRVRVPGVVWIALLGLTAIAMGEMGYQSGLSGTRRSFAVPAFALAFSIVIALIADLDRPHVGWVRVSQLPMQELRNSMTEAPHAPQ